MDKMIDRTRKENQNRDDHCSVSLRKNIPGLIEYNYLCDKLPLSLHKWYIVLSILILLDASLVLFTRAKTPHCRLMLKKVISLIPNEILPS